MAEKTNNKKKVVTQAKKSNLLKVPIKNGDSIIRLPNRMLVVEDGHVIVNEDEYKQLISLKVC